MSPLVIFGSYAVIMVVCFYLFIYVPNSKKRKAVLKMHESLKPGDRVVTIGGVCGQVTAREGDYVVLLTDEEKDVHMRVVVYAIQQLLEPKTEA